MTHKNCAFLTMENTEGWSIDSQLAIAPMKALGWTVESVPWRSTDIDWNRFEAVYVGTPWDYPAHLEQFLAVLETIENSAAILVNNFALVRWNVCKTYLRDLEKRGAHIVPSLWRERLIQGQLPALFAKLSAERLVIKPVVSTNAADTFLVDEAGAKEIEPELLLTFSRRAFVVQPFMEDIQRDGEYSLFFFGGRYSHAIRKLPKPGDFRVQEEHGAEIRSTTPPRTVMDCAKFILAAVQPVPMYARCDLVRAPDGRYLLMELELVEPSMYLRMDAAAPERFAAEFDRHVSVARAIA